jgi:hypothetical protein
VDFDRRSSFIEQDDSLGGRESADALDDAPPSSPSGVRVREGLPAGFRMRHDAHYVDELTARPAEPAIRQISVADLDTYDLHVTDDDSMDLIDSIRQHGALQPILVTARGSRFHVIDGRRRVHAATAAGLSRLPSIVLDVDDAKAEGLRLVANQRSGRNLEPGIKEEQDSGPAQWALVSRLEALAAQGATATGRGFRSSAAMAAFRVDLARTTRVARAGAVIAGGTPLRRRESTAQEIASRVLQETSEICRMSGVPLETVLDAPAFPVPVDFPLIAQALVGCVDALLAQLEEARESDASVECAGPRLTLRLSAVTTRPALFVALAQEPCAVPPDVIARFFDPTFTNRAGGAASAALLGAAARIVRLHGGRADIQRDGDAGATITFILPQSLPRAAARES